MSNGRLRRIERRNDKVVGVGDSLQQTRPWDTQALRYVFVVRAALIGFRARVNRQIARCSSTLAAALHERQTETATKRPDRKLAAGILGRMTRRTGVALECPRTLHDSHVSDLRKFGP